MTFTLSEAKHSISGASYIIESVDIIALDPHDDAGTAYLKTVVEFTDRRRGHFRGRGSTSPNKNARKRIGTTAEADPHPIDKFGRINSPPTVIDGSTIVAGDLTLYGRGRTGENQWTVPIPFFWSVPALKRVGSYVGAWYRAHTQRTADSTCVSLDNQFTGWHEQEIWYRYLMPAHPASMVGIELILQADSPEGYAEGANTGTGILEVMASATLPTDTRQGVLVAELHPDAVDLTATIPSEAIPAEGSYLYVGYRTKWQADYYDWTCGWVWPYGSPEAVYAVLSGNPWSGYSGRAAVIAPRAAVWQVLSAGSTAMGAMEDGDQPWEGGHTWQDGGVVGAPAYEVDGAAFKVSSTANSAKALTVFGEREDATEPWGPWSDADWMVEVVFEVDVLGLVGQPGTRAIEVVTTGEDERHVGTIHLGDGTRAMGISVDGGTESDYAAVTLTTGTKWVAQFDSRSGKLKGKIWKQSLKKPAAWNVECNLTLTEDEGDSFTMNVQVGNVTGAQIVRIHRLRAAQAAVSGERVIKEYLGIADGTTATFYTSHQYVRGSLRALVNGQQVRPIGTDEDLAKFILDGKPKNGSWMRATYVAA